MSLQAFKLPSLGAKHEAQAKEAQAKPAAKKSIVAKVVSRIVSKKKK